MINFPIALKGNFTILCLRNLIKVVFLRARREKKEKDEMNECANAKQLKPQYVPLFVPFLFPAIVSSTKCTDLFFPGNAHTFLAWTISDTWD